ncbi:MAG TPA: radical SAM protein [Myxococcota bacterium]|nr:radical SAM protein [Myxococcota bacterium]
MDSGASHRRIDDFIRRSREAVFIRRADNLLMIRPDKMMKLNDSAAVILAALYNREGRTAAEVLAGLSPILDVVPQQLLADTGKLIDAVAAILNEDFAPREALSFGSFKRDMVAYPSLAEIALTYACQNRCLFCYASSPHRAGEHRLMSTDEVKRVMDKIFHQAHVPSLSFTGGEATLRPNLPELIAYGKQVGFRINLITNGIRLADADYTASLVEAGLDSAQVSLEASDASVHDTVVGRKGAHRKTLAGVDNLRRLGIHVHTNTTLCALNINRAEETIHFLAGSLGQKTMSMNMVIRTGSALEDHGVGVTYTQVAEILPGLIECAQRAGIKLVWYSPIPYCIFNPVLHGMGAKACACVDGILSVDPSGQVLPCSSFQEGIGSLIDLPFEKIYTSRAARYWREKRFIPPVCRKCPERDICGGACPLYWDAAGDFTEIPRPYSDDVRARRRWQNKRAAGGSFGVRPG